MVLPAFCVGPAPDILDVKSWNSDRSQNHDTLCHNNRSLFLTPTVLPLRGKQLQRSPTRLGGNAVIYNLYIETVFIAVASFHVSKIEWRLEDRWFRPSLDSGQLRPRSRDLMGCYWSLSRINAVKYDPARIPKSTIQEKAMGFELQIL